MSRTVWWLKLVLAALLLLAGKSAAAADQCPAFSQRQADPLVATRIAAVACEEHQLWRRPFIDAEGRIASASLHEAEARGLRDGGGPWRRVAFYWQSSGLMSQMAHHSGATDCGYAARNASYPGQGCRGFVVDNPWSAAFISWVMQRAGVPGFRSSPSHFDYVRAARTDPARSPYQFLSPSTAPGLGDMLCYARTNRVYGFAGLASTIDGGATGLPMHCDIVVGIDNAKAYLVGGNVQQGVTMRIINLNATGQFWGLQQRTDGDVECSPDTEAACNFNRQDWAVLLKLKSQTELAAIGPVTPPRFLPSAPTPQTCCVHCVLGSGVPRCPPPGQSLVPQQDPDAPIPGSE